MIWPLEPPIVSSDTASPCAGSQSVALGARLSAFKSNAAAPGWGADARTCNNKFCFTLIFPLAGLQPFHEDNYIYQELLPTWQVHNVMAQGRQGDRGMW